MSEVCTLLHVIILEHPIRVPKPAGVIINRVKIHRVCLIGLRSPLKFIHYVCGSGALCQRGHCHSAAVAQCQWDKAGHHHHYPSHIQNVNMHVDISIFVSNCNKRSRTHHQHSRAAAVPFSLMNRYIHSVFTSAAAAALVIGEAVVAAVVHKEPHHSLMLRHHHHYNTTTTIRLVRCMFSHSRKPRKIMI